MEFYVIVFESTHYAILAEQFFKDEGYTFAIIPTPREITHSCGLSIKFGEEELEKIKESLDESTIIIKGIYKLQKVNNEKIVNQVV